MQGPQYVCLDVGSFVCTNCSGILYEFLPTGCFKTSRLLDAGEPLRRRGVPFRVKGISMSNFTAEEADFMAAHGNKVCVLLLEPFLEFLQLSNRSTMPIFGVWL